MRTSVRTAAILTTMALLASGCGLLNFVPIMGDPSSPTTAPTLEGDTCTRSTFRLVPAGGRAVTPEQLADTVRIVRGRLASAGIRVIRAEGIPPDRYVVTVPSSSDRLRVGIMETKPGKLDFVAVPDRYADQVGANAPLPAGMDAAPMFSGDQIATAVPTRDAQGLPAIEITLKATGARIFDQFASKNYAGAAGGVKVAIVLDGIVLSAPRLTSTHYGGAAQIEGTFTAAEVNDVVTVILFGALPTDVEGAGYAGVSCATGD